jgi:hypothetical protein
MRASNVDLVVLCISKAQGMTMSYGEWLVFLREFIHLGLYLIRDIIGINSQALLAAPRRNLGHKSL